MKVSEIFLSIQGESTYAGLPCVFIRLTGCNMRCTYCDTRYAYTGGYERSIDEIVNAVQSYSIPLVEITGGEPLLQAETPMLVKRLIDMGFHVLIETNGSMSIRGMDSRAIVIMDIKTPRSGEADKLNVENIGLLKKTDEVKFVITGREDYLWAKDMLERYSLDKRCPVLFSPACGVLNPDTLASWIIKDRLPVRLNLQMHKYIFGMDKRGV